jgi:molybdopterin synthase sulfur carrier subunit
MAFETTVAEIEIEVLLFGATADAAGTRRLKKTVSTEMNASELIASLKNEYPGLTNHKLLLSINQQYASESDVIRSGDEVAFFTAVSGG